MSEQLNYLNTKQWLSLFFTSIDALFTPSMTNHSPLNTKKNNKEATYFSSTPPDSETTEDSETEGEEY